MQSMLRQVGEYRVSPTYNTIERKGQAPVKLPPRLIDTLLYFADHAGEVITRKELVDNVWNRTIVTDQTVTQNIFELRKFLRGERNRAEAPEYILTIPKRGYQLVAPVTEIRDSGVKPCQDESALVKAEPSPGGDPPDLTNPDKHGHAENENEAEPTKRGLVGLIKSFWLDESSAGFKRAAY